VEDARLGEATLDVLMTDLNTEVVDAREGAASIVLNLANYVKNGALTTSLDMNGQKITDVADGVASTDLVNLSQATALILAGASPSNIDITSVSVGTLTANQIAGANSGATAVEGKDLTTIDSGSLTASTPVATKSGGAGLEDYDNDLEIAMSSLYLYDNA